MNVLILRHSIDKAINEGSYDLTTAHQLENANDYALSKVQTAAIKSCDTAYIIDADHRIAYIGAITSISESIKVIDNEKGEHHQNIKLSNVTQEVYIDIAFENGWESQKGIKIIPKSDFDILIGKNDELQQRNC
ncbi:hypothetical protein GBN32_10960 [Plesiomonas shigelloides]|uniref:hypothetical protein n=1 Tax=Plesiomonas shigelloides TaxID=703 RepID=UPI00126245AC|nr:hypothetical protein [Plesiomonas shigelloides]KAB7710258.1 hypothetical protein GBN32_10960 [Plesiomonas shigelloides]